MSEINKSKTIKCLGYLWLRGILLMGKPKEGHHLGITDHDIQVTVMPVLYGISFAITDEGEVQ